MTIEGARKLIPPGWVECDEKVWNVTASLAWAMQDEEWVIYAIPAPKPEPRRVPGMGEMVVQFDGHLIWTFAAASSNGPKLIREHYGNDVANTKWRLDPDAREWVEVVE